MTISIKDFLDEYFDANQLKDVLNDIGISLGGKKQELIQKILKNWTARRRKWYDLLDHLYYDDLTKICDDFNINYYEDDDEDELIKRIRRKKILDSSTMSSKNQINDDEKKAEILQLKKKTSKTVSRKQSLKKLVCLYILFTVIASGGVTIIALDIPFLLDPQTIPIQRSYVFAETAWIETEERTLLTVPYFFDMNGTIKLHTTSRSAQNPINVEMILVPYNLEKPSSPERFVEILPETLTFVFPGAMVPNDKNIQYPKKVDVPLKKVLSPLRYSGTGQIEYENEGEYEFYLKERTTMQEGTKESVTLKFEFNLDEDESRLVMAEIAASADEKIIIESFSQTNDVEVKKSTTIFGYLAIVVAVGIFVINDYRKKFNKS